MKGTKGNKIINKQLIEIFGFSKSNLISLLENEAKKYTGTFYYRDFESALKLVKGCKFTPIQKYGLTAKRIVYKYKRNGKIIETTHIIQKPKRIKP